MFVLATMLLMLAIGISTLTASGLSAGSVLAQRDRNQLNLYASSMERTILAALHIEEHPSPDIMTDTLDDVDTLGDWILWYLFYGHTCNADSDCADDCGSVLDRLEDAATASGEFSLPQVAKTLSFNIEVDAPVDDDSVSFMVELSGHVTANVQPFRRFVPVGMEEPDDDDDDDDYYEELPIPGNATPLSATVNAQVVVTLTTTYNGMVHRTRAGEFGAGPTTDIGMITEATYKFSGIVREYMLEETNENLPTLSDLFVIQSTGWELLRYEILMG